MNKDCLGLSIKNIPIPSQGAYMEVLLSKVTDFINRLRWWAFYFDLDKPRDGDHKENFGLKTYKNSPPNSALVEFEDLLKLVKSVKISRFSHPLQGKLQAKISETSSSLDIYVLSDKTGNVYSMATETYDNLINKELFSNYKLFNARAVDDINESHLELVSELDMLHRTKLHSPKLPHCLMKDHKPI